MLPAVIFNIIRVNVPVHVFLKFIYLFIDALLCVQFIQFEVKSFVK